MKFKPGKKQIILGLIGVVIASFVIWNVFFKKTPAQGYKVISQTVIKGVTATGTVESRQDISLAPGLTARIKEIRFKEGDFVRKGQILAVLDKKQATGTFISTKAQLEAAQAQLRNLLTEPRPQTKGIARAQVQQAQSSVRASRNQLETARIQLADAESNVQRLYTLYKEGAVSYRDYEVAKFARDQVLTNFQRTQEQIKTASAALRQAQENLSLVQSGTKAEQIQAAQGQVNAAQGGVISAAGLLDNYILKAPVSGYITSKILDIGEVASATTPVLRLVAQKNLYINAQIEENQLKDLKVGQPAYLVFDAYPAETFMGDVTKVLKSIDPTTGTFFVELEIKDAKIKPVIVGMSLDVNIINRKINNALVIPREFVYTKNRRDYVFKFTGKSAQKVYVSGQSFDNQRFLVFFGLKNGDTIVKSQGRKQLKPDQRLEIKSFYKD